MSNIPSPSGGERRNAPLVASSPVSVMPDERGAGPLAGVGIDGLLARTAPPTREVFSARFDRCFGRVYAYVSRRVNDRESCERIVREVLAANLGVLAYGGDERREVGQLKAASDRLIRSILCSRTPGPLS